MIKDGLGVVVREGDRVRVMAWGWTVRLDDTGRVVTVTGFTPQGNVKHDSTEVANGKAIRPGCLGVLRRDGGTGYEGNREEA